MLAMPSLETYREISVLSARMVEAARAQDWDELVALEKSVTALRCALADSDQREPDDATRELKAELIRRILSDDAEIRRHTEPWMEHVRKFLGDEATRRRVDHAYGTHKS